ncbi:epoxide hydrolase [Flavobacterium sp. MAH-1]|uniref:Epoxide hydrolase n=2 Tax=Flavobacterium agri TaxID=2743471 RepID=A0A7Y8Y0D3_9FLAO|nr:epoxide hydrolase [Flavobacterium agri]
MAFRHRLIQLLLLLAAPICMAQNTALAASAVSGEIRPFKVSFSKADLDDLRHRIKSTKLPEKETVNDFSQGVPLKTIKELTEYWANDYDLDKLEAKLNAYPQFITNIDGLDIHFIHVRSKEPKAMPLILAHGWPGSTIELMKIIDPLTNPKAYGGKAEDAFDVVIPSMPGYGFSGKPTSTGWGPERIASAYTELMKRLGYKKFLAQGGDWGALIVDMMGVQAPPELVAIHTNMAGAVPPEIDKAAFTGAPMPSGLSADERYAYERLAFFYKSGLAYALEMANRPQSLAALSDSPVGLATFLLDHDALSLEMIARSFAGQKEGLSPDDVLDNVSMYWLTNTAVSSSRLYWENKLAFFAPKNVKIPVAVSVFPDEIYAAPKSWAEKAYPNLIYYNKVGKGGHFAAWEQPKLFVEELRAAFGKLRKPVKG